MSGTRREFIKGLAAAGAGATGCRSLCGGSFYGATIRDRLWMWGHHPSFAAALDIPAVKLAKAWIAAYGDDLWGV